MFNNLFPEDNPRVIPRSTLVHERGKWLEVTHNLERRTASGKYSFVCLSGTIFMRRACASVDGKRIGHVDLAMGKDVDYAGQLYFSGRRNRGILRKWTNESGHYRPSAKENTNAHLPLKLFFEGNFENLYSPEPEQI